MKQKQIPWCYILSNPQTIDWIKIKKYCLKKYTVGHRLYSIYNPAVGLHWQLRRRPILLSLFSSHRKNWFALRCEYLHLLKKKLTASKQGLREFFLINMQVLAASCKPVFVMTGKETLVK